MYSGGGDHIFKYVIICIKHAIELIESKLNMFDIVVVEYSLKQSKYADVGGVNLDRFKLSIC